MSASDSRSRSSTRLRFVATVQILKDFRRPLSGDQTRRVVNSMIPPSVDDGRRSVRPMEWAGLIIKTGVVDALDARLSEAAARLSSCSSSVLSVDDEDRLLTCACIAEAIGRVATYLTMIPSDTPLGDTFDTCTSLTTRLPPIAGMLMLHASSASAFRVIHVLADMVRFAESRSPTTWRRPVFWSLRSTDAHFSSFLSALVASVDDLTDDVVVVATALTGMLSLDALSKNDLFIALGRRPGALSKLAAAFGRSTSDPRHGLVLMLVLQCFRGTVDEEARFAEEAASETVDVAIEVLRGGSTNDGILYTATRILCIATDVRSDDDFARAERAIEESRARLSDESSAEAGDLLDGFRRKRVAATSTLEDLMAGLGVCSGSSSSSCKQQRKKNKKNKKVNKEDAGGMMGVGSEDACVVCLDCEPEVILRPCGHAVLCSGCHDRVAAHCEAAGVVMQCPVCRGRAVYTKRN